MAEARAAITAKMAKNLRPGKVFIDWSQNSRHKTTICAYSLRARPTPTVSTPSPFQSPATGWGVAAFKRV